MSQIPRSRPSPGTRVHLSSDPRRGETRASPTPMPAVGNHPVDPKRRRQLETPEGVLLSVVLPDHATRATALALDVTFWAVATLALWIVTLLVRIDGALLLPFFVLVSGLVRNFYFLFFELRWQGQTPGKRLMKLRVVDNRGGPLLPQAVIARNLMREIELTLPLSLTLLGGAGSLGQLLLLGWFGLFVLFPLFNRDRMRCGDLVAGTWVIEMPAARLAPDLAAGVQTSAKTPPPSPRRSAEPTGDDSPAPTAATANTDANGGFTFTDHQLRRYEVRHLQVLEEVLRRPEDPPTRQLREQIAANIARKIGYEPMPHSKDSLRFLTAFYAQFRNRLERSQIFHGKADPTRPGKD